VNEEDFETRANKAISYTEAKQAEPSSLLSVCGAGSATMDPERDPSNGEGRGEGTIILSSGAGGRANVFCG